MVIIKVIKSKQVSKIIGVTSLDSVEYKLGDIFKNIDNYYFEVDCVESEGATFTYHLNNIGYYKLLKNAKLKDFNFDLTLVTDKEELSKILDENCYC